MFILSSSPDPEGDKVDITPQREFQTDGGHWIWNLD